MELGAFSISLAVKDIAASRAFYEQLGFRQVGGDPAQNWLILRSGETTIGLFQGMFERNMLTFNPGWTSQCEPLGDFADIREIERDLAGKGVSSTMGAIASAAGPASLMLVDPDGNPVLIDQHVDSPAGLGDRLAGSAGEG